jgi:hypothetical protein
MLLWAFILFVIFIAVLWLIERVLKKRGIKVKRGEEKKHWTDDPVYSSMPGNIFHRHDD